jgi:acetyl-CoA C-acetyltransferase
MSDDIVIVSAARTAVSAFNGALGSLPAHELGSRHRRALGAGVRRLSRGDRRGRSSPPAGPEPGAAGPIAAGIPVESPAWGVNQLCGSGLRAVARLSGDPERRSSIVVAGSQNR